MKKIFIIGITLLSLAFHVKGQNVRMVSFFDTKDGVAYYLAWDIKTGKSTQYHWDDGKWQSMEINLPAQPLTGALGNILFEVYFDYNDGKAYYVCWDSKTGRSKQFYWEDGKWATMEINLPATPLPGAKGEILIRPYFDSKDGKAYYVVYDTFQGKSIQYYWEDGKWVSMEINLPAIPVK